VIYALIIAYGTLIPGQGLTDIYYDDASTYIDIVTCEHEKDREIAYLRSIHPWVNWTKGACVPGHPFMEELDKDKN
jgi:hypothetical protein